MLFSTNKVINLLPEVVQQIALTTIFGQQHHFVVRDRAMANNTNNVRMRGNGFHQFNFLQKPCNILNGSGF